MQDTDHLRQSGVIAYRYASVGLEIVLVTNRDGGRWLVPKGHIEPDMSPHASAAKEAFEEAGVLGRVENRVLGDFRITKRSGLIKVIDLFPLQVHTELVVWPEMQTRRRRWASIEQALAIVDDAALAACNTRLADAVAAPLAASAA